jgi:hypothetical protein
MKKLIAIAFVAATAAAPCFAFGLPPIPGIGGGSSSGGAQADLSGQQDALVRNFVAASKQVLVANSSIADALGLKEKATDAEKTAGSLGDGATKDNLAESNKVVADSSGAIAQKLAEKPVLDAASKAKYVEGVGHLVTGTVKYAGLGNDVKDMGSSIKSASPLALAKLGSAAFIVSNFPGSASDLYRTVKAAIDFARSQGMEVPGADDALKAIGGNNS